MRASSALLACLSLLCGACGRSHPTLRPLRPDSVVVAFGDSLTSGVGVPNAETYPALLARRLGCAVINAGVAGELTDEGLRRLPAVLRDHRPDLVILCHGGNDLLHSRPESVIEANLAAMIETIRAHGADIVLVGVPRPGLILRAAPFYQDLAQKFRVPYESRIVARILSTPSLKSDQIHPNDKGNERLAEAIEGLIRTCEPR